MDGELAGSRLVPLEVRDKSGIDYEEEDEVIGKNPERAEIYAREGRHSNANFSWSSWVDLSRVHSSWVELINGYQRLRKEELFAGPCSFRPRAAGPFLSVLGCGKNIGSNGLK